MPRGILRPVVIPGFTELAQIPVGERAAALRDLLARGRRDAALALAAGAGGISVCAQLSDLLDSAVLALIRADHLGPIALLATGGWGRRETCPFSDLDLLILTPGEPDEAARQLAERTLYPLWDAGLEIGHAVRSVG